MTELIRSAKSGSDWTKNDLLSYNIKVTSFSPEEFYGEPLPSLSDIDPYLVDGTLDTQGLSDETYRLLQYLDLASKANSGQESAIDDFAREILRVLGYESRGLLLRSRYNIPLLICGDSNQSVQTDVCLVQGASTILLVIQEDKITISSRDPEPQVIAEAIAAFQNNNRNRQRLGHQELDMMVIPAITMIGTRPIFYLVPVTMSLSDAIATAQYPTTPTIIKKCVVASGSRRLSEGMESKDFRHLALQHYTAFRTLAKTHWSSFMV